MHTLLAPSTLGYSTTFVVTGNEWSLSSTATCCSSSFDVSVMGFDDDDDAFFTLSGTKKAKTLAGVLEASCVIPACAMCPATLPATPNPKQPLSPQPAWTGAAAVIDATAEETGYELGEVDEPVVVGVEEFGE